MQLYFMSIGNNIRRLRKEKKISPDFLAQKAGKGGRQWIYDIEKGKTKRVSEEDLEIIAKILSVSVSELRKKEGKQAKESFKFYLPRKENDLSKLKGFKEKYYYLLEENRTLWQENAYLKTVLLENGIDIYNPEDQDDTV